MPATINGFGTKYYGEADRRPDGSFITTEWITLAYLPVVPLRSFRLAPIKESGTNVLVSNSTSYAVFEQLEVCWPQVLRIYGFVLAAAGWTWAMTWLFFDKLSAADHSRSSVWIFAFLATLPVPFIMVWWLRRESYKARHSDSSTAQPPPLP